MRPAALLLALALAAPLAACSPPKPPVRLRHEAKRKLVYELKQREDARDEDVGLGGVLDVTEKVEFACIAVEPEGSGHVEVTVRDLKLAAPSETGAQVDSASTMPVPGDTIGANTRARALLPRTALVVIGRDALVTGVHGDDEVVREVNDWMKGKPVAARKAIVRIAESLDAAPLAARWLRSVAQILPRDEHAAAGAAWKTELPAIETPAGGLSATMDVTLRREGDHAILEGRGAFSLQGTPPAERPIDFAEGTLDAAARIDVLRGVLLHYEEKGAFTFRRTTGDPAPIVWELRRTMRLVE